MLLRRCLLMLLLVGGCADRDRASWFNESKVRDILEPFGVGATVDKSSAARLSYHAIDEDCAQSYRIDVSYQPKLKFEEDSTSGLALRRDPRTGPYHATPGRRDSSHGMEVGDGPLPEGAIVPGELFYLGFRAERVGATRDFYISEHAVGPASSIAGCFWRTYDPMDDAFALGWPKLPGRLTAEGETWEGLPVEGQCSRAACVDENGGGGPDSHFRPCATGPFTEQLAGIYEIGGEPFALIRSTWSDAHEHGISSERMALVSIRHGRPAWARTVVDHQYKQITADGGTSAIVRTWEMTAIDECPGSLASVGWTRPDADTERATDLLGRLENAEDLRRTAKKKGPRPEPE